MTDEQKPSEANTPSIEKGQKIARMLTSDHPGECETALHMLIKWADAAGVREQFAKNLTQVASIDFINNENIVILRISLSFFTKLVENSIL